MAQGSQHGNRLGGTDLEAQPAADALAAHHFVMLALFAYDTVGGADRFALLASVALQADEGGGANGDAVQIRFLGAFINTDGAGAALLVIYPGQRTFPGDGSIGAGLLAYAAGGAALLALSGQPFGFGLADASQIYLLGLGGHFDDVLGTGQNASATADASGIINLGQALRGKGDCIVGTDFYAISEPDTTEQAFTMPSVKQHCAFTAFHSMVIKTIQGIFDKPLAIDEGGGTGVRHYRFGLQIG